MKEWELHEKHDNDIKNIMNQTGNTFRKWDGKKFWTIAKDMGHTSLDFFKCQCKNHKTE